MKHIAEFSNSNLIQNANCLMAKNEAKIEFSWVTNTHPQSQTKFKLGYWFFLEKNNVNAQTT